jgi:hypothetical protein
MAEALQGTTNNVDTQPLRLKWSEKERTVIFESPDDDFFTMKVKEVIKACNIQQESDEFESQFSDLKNILGNWINKRKEKIAKAFVTVRDTRILLVVVTKEVEYDNEFENELTVLDWEVSHTPFLSAIPLSVQSLPQCDDDIYESFLSPPIVLEYIG